MRADNMPDTARGKELEARAIAVGITHQAVDIIDLLDMAAAQRERDGALHYIVVWESAGLVGASGFSTRQEADSYAAKVKETDAKGYILAGQVNSGYDWPLADSALGRKT